MKLFGISAALVQTNHGVQIHKGVLVLKQNEGRIDRILRVTLGTAILSLAFWGPQTPWAYLGIVPILTGLVGVCPLYSILGINTCSR